MATIVAETLKDLYAALQAERERSWSPQQLAGNARQRQILVDRFDPAAVAQPGDVLPPLSLSNVDGGTLTLDTLTASGLAVLIFFRYAGCPACNIALPHYAQTLYPALRDKGISLVALSPQPAAQLKAIKDRHDLPFAVATDDNNALADLLGISFVPDDRPEPPPAGWIGDVTGTGSWALPQPSVLLLAPGRVVQWLDVSPDWLARTETADILSAID